LGLDGLTPMVKFLLLANIAIFLLQIFVVREVRISPLERLRKYNPALDKMLSEKEKADPKAVEAFKKKLAPESEFDTFFVPPERISIVQEWFELATNKVVYGGQVWRLLTHAFCHDRHGLWHIFFNMLCLYWFGGTLETMYGGREFLLFYLTAAVVAGLAFVGLDLHTGSSVPGIGAVGAGLGGMRLLTPALPPADHFLFLWRVAPQLV